MIFMLIIRLSALSLGLSYVSSTTPQQHAQLATLNERVNQLISSLYSSPLLSKVQSAASSSEEFPSSTSSQESSYNYPTSPHVVYVAPPSFLEAGAQPIDYGYPTTTNPVPRSAWPYYDYSFQPQYPHAYPPYSRTLPPYPDYARAAYPPIAAPAPLAPLPPVPFPTPVPYPTFANSVPFPTFPPIGPVSSPYSPQIPYQQSIFAQIPIYPPVVPYPPVSAPFAPPPPAFAPPPSLTPYSSSISVPYGSSFPVPYPSIPVPYSHTILPSYPPPVYPTAPVFPKSSDILPQPQYDYSA